MSEASGPWAIPLPAPVGRRPRFGPFPTAGAALRFAAVATAGLLAALAVGPIAWLPFLGGGFLLTTRESDGRTLDERLLDRVAYEVRRRRRSPGPRARGPARPLERVVRLPDGHRLVVIAAGGIPVAYLPPPDARALFDGYVELLRSLDGPIFVRVTSEPWSDRAFRLPAGPAVSEGERTARAGYDALVRLLCQRRRRRRIEIAIWSGPSGGPDDPLESRARGIEERLATLGVPATRLAGPVLRTAVERAGFPSGGRA